MPNPEMREFAQRLIAFEAATHGASESGMPAVLRVSEKLRRPLSALAGTSGFRSLLDRALTLGKRESDGLSSVRVNQDGSLEWIRIQNSSAAEEAGIALIAQLLGLLVTFVGYSLTLRLVQDAWPDLPSDTKSE